jgi:hypothetical protein
MAGFLFCDLYLGGHVRTERRSHLWYFFLGSAAAVMLLTRFQLDYPFLQWLALLAFVSAFRGKITHWLLGCRLLTTLGGMCYTIYMCITG